MTGTARAFDGRWCPVDVVLVGPRSVRVVSIAGEVSRDVPVKLSGRLANGDTSGELVLQWLQRAGYRNVTMSIEYVPKENLP